MSTPTDRDASTNQTDDVTYDPSSTISPPEQQSGNRPSGSVSMLTSMGPGDSNSRSSVPRLRPSSSPQKVVEEEIEDTSGSLLEEKGAGYKDIGIKKQGLIVFRSLESRIAKLDGNLGNFANAVSPLGSSAVLRKAADDFRRLLEDLLGLFSKNASELFGEIDQDLPNVAKHKDSPIFRKVQRRFRGSPKPHEFFASLADGLKNLFSRLNQFSEFKDEIFDVSVELFLNDLEYWEFCLKEHKEQYDTPYIRLYLNDVSADIGKHLENISPAVAAFTKNAVPTIQFCQSRVTGALQNLSTVATLFSGVTAAGISFSYQNFKTRTQVASNLLWIISLVFSLASAMNSQLAYHWRSAIYRSHVESLPPWVSIWIVHTPLIFLIASVIAFLGGLVCFTFSHFNISPVIPIVTTICTSISSIALLTGGFWFAGERYTYYKTGGRKWLADAIDDARARFVQACVKFCHSALEFRWASSVWIRRPPPPGGGGSQNRSISDDCDVHSSAENAEEDVEKRTILRVESPERSGTEERIINRKPEGPTQHAPDHPPATNRSGPNRNEGPLSGLAFNIVRRMLKPPQIDTRSASLEPVSSLLALPPSSPAPRIGYSPVASHPVPSFEPVNVVEQSPPKTRPSNLGDSVPTLKSLRVSQTLCIHTAILRDIQFSPDGKYLASCGWDKTAVIWKFDSKFTAHQKLEYPGVESPGQVQWSPDGKYLLVKSAHGIKLWQSETESWQPMIHWPQFIHNHPAIWMPNSNEVIIIEGWKFIILSTNDRALREYESPLRHLVIYDIAVTLDEQRILAVATLSQTPEGIRPSDPRHMEKQIFVLNLESGNIERRIPMHYEVRYITLFKSVALVSSEDKAPPQLFRLRQRDGGVDIDLLHTYSPPSKAKEFGRPSYLGHFAGRGIKHMIVLSADRCGMVHFWDRKTTKLLRSFRVRKECASPPTISWNNANRDQLMFASGGDDDTIEIWTAPRNGNEGIGQ